MFNKLVKAHTQAEIDHLKNKHFPFMNKKASKYLNTVNDVAQYPGARVEMEGYGNIFMYQIQHHRPWNQIIGQTVQQGLEVRLMWYALPNSSYPCQLRGITAKRRWYGNGKGN